ncbi:MAG: hypothetical protein FWD62_05375 [Betaproteobacteria bacterium]|nr:hypothetical protein [Betaproteobacteria bacterium]
MLPTSPLEAHLATLTRTNFCAVQKEVAQAATPLQAVAALAHEWLHQADRLCELIDQERCSASDLYTATDVAAAVRAAMTQVLNVLLYHGHDQVLQNIAQNGERP